MSLTEKLPKQEPMWVIKGEPEITRAERIEKLKLNKIVFGEMVREDKDLLQEIIIKKDKNIQRRSVVGWQPKRERDLYDNSTYRISPDYTEAPEPKVVRCEVEVELDRCHYFRDSGEKVEYLHEALSLPNFIGFEYSDSTISIEPRRLYQPEEGCPAEYPKYVLFSEVQK